MTSRGLTARANSLQIPLRSHVPGADDSIHTSEIFHNAINSSTPLACFRSTPIDSLFLATSASSAPCGRGPRVSNGAVVRNESPPTRSMWITSAPNSASFVPMYGWAINTPVPTARTPASGPNAGITAGVAGRSNSWIHAGTCRLNSSTRSSSTSRASCAHRQPPSRHTRIDVRRSRYTLPDQHLDDHPNDRNSRPR